MPQKFDNLACLDWDDSALIKAYDKGMALKAKNQEQGTSKEEKRTAKKKKECNWRVGDFCRAVYYGDNLTYEAKVVTISDDLCIVEFLGYDEEVEVELDSLSESNGKKARKKQIKGARLLLASGDGSVSADDSRNEHSASESSAPRHYKKKGHKHHGNHHLNRTFDHSAAETTFHSMHPVVHSNEVAPTMMIPPAPPMPQCSEVSQNPSLCAMLTSWYMAGYYTGLHQAQKNQCQRCFCRSTQNYCHH